MRADVVEITPRATSTGFQVTGSFVRLIYISIGCVNVLLIVATLLSDLGVTLPRGLGQFDLKLEGNFATWYSSALLFLAGGASLLIAISPAPSAVGQFMYRVAWTGTSMALLALSVDEMNELHERVGVWFTERFGFIPGFTQGGSAIFAWTVALLPLVALFIAAMIAIVRSWLPVNRLSRNLAAAALCCWIGALVAEVTEAELFRLSLSRSVEGTVEEGLEIVGSALFFAAFCEYLHSEQPRGWSTKS